jgi:hypothetical protein
VGSLPYRRGSESRLRGLPCPTYPPYLPTHQPNIYLFSQLNSTRFDRWAIKVGTVCCPPDAGDVFILNMGTTRVKGSASSAMRQLLALPRPPGSTFDPNVASY